MGIPRLNYHSWGCFVCCQIKALQTNTCSTSQVMMSSRCDPLQTCANCVNVRRADDDNKAFLENHFLSANMCFIILSRNIAYSLSCDQVTYTMHLSACLNVILCTIKASKLSFPTDTHNNTGYVLNQNHSNLLICCWQFNILLNIFVESVNPFFQY